MQSKEELELKLEHQKIGLFSLHVFHLYHAFLIFLSLLTNFLCFQHGLP
jgi:hypothetical protein